MKNCIANVDELRLKCGALRANWIHEETFQKKNKASALDIFDQMTRMRTSMKPSHPRVKVFFAGKPVGDGVLQAMQEWHAENLLPLEAMRMLKRNLPLLVSL